jgi:hypothetical protein
MDGGGYAERFLARKVVEEGPLRDSGRLAEVVHRGSRKTLGPDDVPRRIEKPRAGIAAFGGVFGRPWHEQ